MGKKNTLAKKNDISSQTNRSAKRHRVMFSVRVNAGSSVFLAGDFNGWDPYAKPMTDKKGEGVFTAVLLLLPGDYAYKFVIDGTWCVDPQCQLWAPNEYGTLNSIKHID